MAKFPQTVSDLSALSALTIGREEGTIRYVVSPGADYPPYRSYVFVVGSSLETNSPIVVNADDSSGQWIAQDLNTIIGTSSPSLTPAFAGLHFVDSASGTAWIATGTSSSSDWVQTSSAST